MNDGSNATTASALAQSRAQTPRIPRPISADTAESFGRVLDALIRPDRTKKTAAQDAADSQTQQPGPDKSPETDQTDAADASAGDAPGDPRNGTQKGTQSDAPPSGGQSDAPNPESAAQSPDKGAVHRADGAGADAVQPVPPGAMGEVLSTGSIRRELTHAASVDVSTVAHEELKSPNHDEKQKAHNQMDGPLWARNPGPIGPQRNARNADQGENQPANQPPRPVPTPDPHAAGTGWRVRADLAEANPAGQPAAGIAEPARASTAAAQVAPNASKPEPAQPVQGVVGRSGVLERLTGSAEAARGAVAAVDRAGLQAGQRETSIGRAATPAPGQQAATTREALLNSVQRGLASVLTQGGGRMTVVLRPEALGEVRVRLEAKDGVVNARLSATTDAARRTLESGLETLRAALEARGVRVESLRIDPPDHQAADQSAQAGRADADARGTDQHQHRQHNADHQTPGPHGPRADSQDGASAAGNDASPEYPGRGIWTELGIDAVA